MNPFSTEANPSKETAAPVSFSRKANSSLLYLPFLFFLLLSFQLGQAQSTQITAADIPSDNVSPFTKTIAGQVFTFTPASNGGVWVDYFNDIGTEGFGGLYAYDGSSFDGTEFTFSAPAGYTFDVNSFQYISDRGVVNLNLTITFANNTTDIKNYVLTGNYLVQTFSGFTIAANDIKSIRFVTDALVYYNNLGVTDVKAVAAMPVTWLGFTAVQQGNKAALNWSTALEQNAKDFVVQHSTDGRNWNTVGTVAAAGTTNTAQTYSFLHSSPVNGVNYYRLLQRDIDNRKSYSKVVTVDLYGSGKQVSVYPNPSANGVVTIKLQQASNVQVYNNQGILVWQKQLTAGVHSLDLGHVAKGVYTVNANNESLSVLIQ